MASHADSDSDSDSEGDYCYYYNVTTKERMKVSPQPAEELEPGAHRLPVHLPETTFKSALSTVLLTREHLPRLTRALQHYYQREKLPEQPRIGSWTIVSPATGYILCNILSLLHHARQANDYLPPQAIKDLKTAHKIVLRAVKLRNLVDYQLESNAGYRELYWEVMPKLQDVLKGVVEDFNEGGVVEQAI